jgi:hypothetical protein
MSTFIGDDTTIIGDDIRIENWSPRQEWEYTRVEVEHNDWYLWGAVHYAVKIIRGWKSVRPEK